MYNPIYYIFLFPISLYMNQSLQSQERQQEKFSFLIISRSDGEKAQETEHWDMARLISQVRRRPRHVQCQLCCANGELKQLAVTARHHGKYVVLSFNRSLLALWVNDLLLYSYLYYVMQVEIIQVVLTMIFVVHFNRDMYRCARSSDWGDLLPIFHAEDSTENDETQWGYYDILLMQCLWITVGFL